MTAILTLTLLLGLFVLIALPGLATIVRPRAAILAAPFYLLVVGGLLLHHLGLSFGGEMPAAARPSGTAPEGLCRQAIEQAEAGGLIVDRRNPVRVSVRRELWAQLPEQAKDGIVLCLETVRPANAADTPVEIVEVPAG